MRIAVAIALVAAMSGAEIERAQQVARSRESERAQFHRRLCLRSARRHRHPDRGDHGIPAARADHRRASAARRPDVLARPARSRSGDGARRAAWSPSSRSCASTRSTPTPTFPRSSWRSGPAALNGDLGRDSTADALDTKVERRVLAAVQGPRRARDVTALLGATLQADIPASRIGQASRPVGVVLDGREIARVPVDFARLD